MLTKRFVYGLAVLTVAISIAACLVHYNRWTETIRNVKEELVFPELAGKLESISKIKVSRSEKDDRGSFIIQPYDEIWGIKEKGGYQTRSGVIRETLIGLSQLVYQEAKTKDPNRHTKLELSDIRKETSRATRLIIEDSQGTILVDALFGKRLPNLSGGTPSLYMRKTQSPQTWLTKGEIQIRGGTLNWLSVVLMSVQRERLKNILLTSPSGSKLQMFYNKTFEKFEIRNLEKDREVKSNFQLLNVGVIPENLLLQDVRPAQLTPDPTLGGAQWETVDGLTIELSLAADKSNATRIWAFVNVKTDDNASEEVIKEAQEIEKKTKGWEFWLGKETIAKLQSTATSLTKVKQAD